MNIRQKTTTFFLTIILTLSLLVVADYALSEESKDPLDFPVVNCEYTANDMKVCTFTKEESPACHSSADFKGPSAVADFYGGNLVANYFNPATREVQFVVQVVRSEKNFINYVFSGQYLANLPFEVCMTAVGTPAGDTL